MVSPYTPQRGDLVYTDSVSTSGHEQAMRRPALVLSVKNFNKKMKLALVAPITRTVRGHGFEVILEGSRTEGAVLCHQIRMIDFKARNIQHIERCPADILEDALAKVRTIFN